MDATECGDDAWICIIVLSYMVSGNLPSDASIVSSGKTGVLLILNASCIRIKVYTVRIHNAQGRYGM